MNGTQISPPWVTYARKMQALFEQDRDVTVKYDNESRTLDLLVEGNDKASAISSILPNEVEFGNVKLTIAVKPSNDDSPEAIVRKAFAGNDAVASIETIETDVPLFGDRTYVLFKPEVVQFFDDDMTDINGICTTIYQDIAREVFETGPGVSFCTEIA